MEYQEIYRKIQEEHRQVFEKMDQENMREFMDEIKKHPRIFFIGVSFLLSLDGFISRCGFLRYVLWL